MPSRRSRNDLVLFSSRDPQSLVNWLCGSFGVSAILRSISRYRPSGSGDGSPGKRAYKKSGGKKHGGRKGGAAKAHPQKGTGRRGRPRKQAEAAAKES